MKPAALKTIIAAAAMLASPAFVSLAFATTATDVVPVDISMIQEDNGKGITFQNTFAQPFYTWDKDQPSHSNCNDHCAEIWVPVYPTDRNPKNLGDFTLVTRADGNKQWAYKGQPIYTFGYGEHEPPTAKETQNQWHILKP